jgi:hypothetical protein
MDRRIIAVLASTSVASMATGLVAGYQIAKRRLEAGFERELTEQIAATKTTYQMLYKVGPYAKLADRTEDVEREVPAGEVTAEQAAGALALYQDGEVSEPTLIRVLDGLKRIPIVDYTRTEELTTDEETAVEEVETLLDLRPENALEERHLFQKLPDDWPTYEEYVRNLRQGRDRPYLIPVDMFMHEEVGFRQSTLTFFEEDGVLVDEREMPIPDVDGVVGEGNMDKFGMFTNGDKNTVYIRNEKMCMDFEVLRNEGSYGRDVAGFVEHSEKRRGRRNGWDADE